METSENITKIRDLFEQKTLIKIPAYQRAYSWEREQCVRFLQDLKEQKHQYYLGQFIFEIYNKEWYIIDGQQRLTTTVIFMAALAKNLYEKHEIIDGIKSRFLSNKFSTIEEDNGLFCKIITDFNINLKNVNANTNSQKNIIKAFKYFENELRKLYPEDLNKLKEILEQAKIGTFFINTKIEATQIFEYQNNRGVRPSQFELIKAYLMNRIYLVDKDELSCNEIIKDIQLNISETYRSMESSKKYFSEDELLEIFCNLAYDISGNIESLEEHLEQDAININNEDDDESDFEEEKKYNDLVIQDYQKNKIEWIRSFFKKFKDLCHYAHEISNNMISNNYILNLFLFSGKLSWKHLLIAIWSLNEQNNEKIKKLFRYIEIICFKYSLTKRKKDNFYYDARSIYNKEVCFSELFKKLRHYVEYGFEDNWDDFQNSIKDYCKRDDYYNDIATQTKYVLWQYENSLRKINDQINNRKEYSIYTIEHIFPKIPTDTDKEKLNEKYIHCLGNLSLLTQSDNSRNSNKSFVEKIPVYEKYAKSSKLIQYKEILQNGKWGRNNILSRKNKILEFINKYFDWSKV
jgi:hypothetical protein